jgi:ATP-dependent Zn protease
MIVIVLLAYLGSQTLVGEDETRLPYSEVRQIVFSHPETVDELTFRPNERTVVLKLTNGTTIRADYPRAATPAFEPPMAQGAARDSKDTGSFWSRWAIGPLLPFALLVALVIFLANRRQSRISNEDLRAP